MAFFMLSFPRITKNCPLYVSMYDVTDSVLLASFVEAQTSCGVPYVMSCIFTYYVVRIYVFCHTCLRIYVVRILSYVFHLGYICYDDGCHLKRFAQNSVRSDVSAIAKFIAQLHIVIDRMHFKGHIDEWCKQNCNPDSFSDLDNVRMCVITYVL